MDLRKWCSFFLPSETFCLPGWEGLRGGAKGKKRKTGVMKNLAPTGRQTYKTSTTEKVLIIIIFFFHYINRDASSGGTESRLYVQC